MIEHPDDLAKGSFLTTTNFYDDKSRLLQLQSGNHKGGTDITTNRYDFSGRIICNYVNHSNPAAGAEGNIRIKTNYEFDATGRLTQTWKTINDEAGSKTLLAANEYSVTRFTWCIKYFLILTYG